MNQQVSKKQDSEGASEQASTHSPDCMVNMMNVLVRIHTASSAFSPEFSPPTGSMLTPSLNDDVTIDDDVTADPSSAKVEYVDPS